MIMLWHDFRLSERSKTTRIYKHKDTNAYWLLLFGALNCRNSLTAISFGLAKIELKEQPNEIG